MTRKKPMADLCVWNDPKRRDQAAKLFKTKQNEKRFENKLITQNSSLIDLRSTNGTQIQFQRTFLAEARVLARFQENVRSGIDT